MKNTDFETIYVDELHGLIYKYANPFESKDLIPTKIIYNNKTTICYFGDNTKEVVRCADGEDFDKEVGVMSCIMKRLFKSRNEFKRLVDGGYVQPQS